MTIEQRTVGGVIVLSIAGDIMMNRDGETEIADTVRRHLGIGRSRILLDLARVRYVDSFGLGQLVQAFSSARNRGGALKLINVTTRLTDLLVVTGLLTVFDCFDEESAALASFDPQPVAH